LLAVEVSPVQAVARAVLHLAVFKADPQAALVELALTLQEQHQLMLSDPQVARAVRQAEPRQ